MSYGGLDGKLALVTGGTGGIGFSIATLLLEGGAEVVVNGRAPERGEEAVARLKKISPKVRFVAGDCGSAAEVGAVIKGAVSPIGGLDILVSAGAEGSGGPKPFADMTLDDIDLAFRTRLYPRIFPVHAALPALRQKGGSIVMLTTDAAKHPTPGEAVMGAAGASVMLMTKTLAKEFARWRIRVNSVALTLTSGTPGWERIFARASFQKDLFSKALAKFPMGRAPTSEEVAKIAAFLVSDDALQVTGQTVSANGGLSFGGW